mmetsp:Transcript_74504/g.205372  ORF Transcript_74504/g.205372 Transcript_74504/m.205372 type:complete len:583 (+) Transcript_74504:981-2729(+)
MHCTPGQQFRLAKLMTEHLSNSLISYQDLIDTGRPVLLSPLDLKRRVLLKGKIKLQSKRSRSLSNTFIRARLESNSGRARSLSDCRKQSKTGGGGARTARKNSSKQSQRRSSELAEESFKADEESFKASGLYVEILALRSLPISDFLGDAPPKWPLAITSINEDRLLRELGLQDEERNQIEGLSSTRVRGGISLTEEQMSSRAIARLAADPPQQVGSFQRRTRAWLLRPYPLGLRFSGKNMSPLPGWLAGGQGVCLNFSDADLAVQLHFALFSGHAGFVLKPREMRDSCSRGDSSAAAGGDAVALLARLSNVLGSSSSQDLLEDSDSIDWPPLRDELQRTTVNLLSLHTCPKRTERRPRLTDACHRYHPELSGSVAPPDSGIPSSPRLQLSIHAIGGFCALCSTQLLPKSLETEISTASVTENGLNAAFNETVYCYAAEPHGAFLRIGVVDGRQEVAYAIAVLGRLRNGLRVFQLRSLLGTRIELAYLLVRISSASVPNLWVTPRQQERQVQFRQSQGEVQECQRKRIEELEEAVRSLRVTLSSSAEGGTRWTMDSRTSRESVESSCLERQGEPECLTYDDD